MLKRLKEWSQFRRVRAWYQKYERLLLPAVLLFGFIGDTIAVRTINLEIVRFILLGHLLVVGGGIIIANLPERRVQSGLLRYIKLFAPLATLYSLGALFSIFIVLYSHSGSLLASWPFLLPLVLLFIGTEVFKRQYAWLIAQVSALFFALMSYMVLFVPYALRSVGTGVFLLSGAISVVIMLGYVFASAYLVPRIQNKKDILITSISTVFVLVNILYFINAIPPFPLSLRDVGIYHSVERLETGEYEVLKESEAWYEVIMPFDTVHVSSGGERLYLYSSIFAPTNLATEVVHNWKKWQEGRWVTMSAVSYQLIGGREDGYRGYTYKSNVTPGWWRVTVETEEGKVIGATIFRAIEASGSVPTHLERY